MSKDDRSLHEEDDGSQRSLERNDLVLATAHRCEDGARGHQNAEEPHDEYADIATSAVLDSRGIIFLFRGGDFVLSHDVVGKFWKTNKNYRTAQGLKSVTRGHRDVVLLALQLLRS